MKKIEMGNVFFLERRRRFISSPCIYRPAAVMITWFSETRIVTRGNTSKDGHRQI